MILSKINDSFSDSDDESESTGSETTGSESTELEDFDLNFYNLSDDESNTSDTTDDDFTTDSDFDAHNGCGGQHATHKASQKAMENTTRNRANEWTALSTQHIPELGLIQEFECLRGKRGQHTNRKMSKAKQKEAGIVMFDTLEFDIHSLHQLKTTEMQNAKYLIMIMPIFKNGNAFNFFQAIMDQQLLPNLKEIYGWYWKDAMTNRMFHECVPLWYKMGIKVVSLGAYSDNDRDDWVSFRTFQKENMRLRKSGREYPKLLNTYELETCDGEDYWVLICQKLQPKSSL